MTTTSSELEQSFKGPGFGFTFLYYFVLATLIGGIVAMEILHVGPTSALPYQYGIAFGLPFGVINALTKRSQTFSVQFKKQQKFLRKLKTVLEELGFDSESDPEIESGVTYQTFRKAGMAGWFAASVFVAIAEKEAVIASRSSVIKKLKNNLE